MNGAQLRDHGKQLFEVWFDYICGPDPRDENISSWNSLAPSSFGLLLCELVKKYRPAKNVSGSPFDRRIAWLAETFELDRTEQAILSAAARCTTHVAWRKLMHALPGEDGKPTALRIAYVTGLNPAEIDDRLGAGRRLSRCGLIDNDSDGEVSANRLLERIARSNSPPSRLARQLMPAAPRSSLQWSDFDHIGPQRAIAQALIAADRGASILLYGPPGTGKSEFARLLADTTGKRALFAGLEDENGREPTRRERLTHLAILRALVRKDPTRLVVLDEADDVLRLNGLEDRGFRSKLFLNRLVEEAERPTIWIINDPDCLDRSIVRRMSLAIEFPLPPRSVRRRVVERHARAARLKLAQPEIDRLASIPAAPAVIFNALASAKAAGGGAKEALAISEGLVAVISGEQPHLDVLPPCYDPALAYADADLDALAGRLERASDPAWSLLLSGPSGTGKSAFARHLAERLGIDLLVKRGSDLLSPFVGITEANIAQAFREAARGRCLLLIDEADDFLADRREAQRSWERSMVNQMLRQMEALECPFVATTNNPQMLDPATQRRFTMRVAFRALDADRTAQQFRRWFGSGIPPGFHLTNTTPGDFAVVAKRAQLLGECDPRQLARWLWEEAEARGEMRAAIGFVA
jgi:SpoVK/Ycf46/Vps4 family AAA+-type ATPase